MKKREEKKKRKKKKVYETNSSEFIVDGLQLRDPDSKYI